MGEFIKRVQANRVPGPLRRNFSLQNWEAEFAAAPAPDDSDKNIYEAALVIYEKLQNIRARLKLSTSKNLSATTKLRAFVAAANHNFIVAQDRTRSAFATVGESLAKRGAEGFGIDEVLAAVKLNLPGGFDWSPNEVVESLVDGIEIPVRVTLYETPDLTGNARMSQVEWKDIVLELNLGILYRHTEDLWDECLWNGYRLVDAGRLKVFLPQDSDLISGHRVGICRRMSLTMGYSVIATRVHHEMAARGSLPNIREVREIKRQGRRQIIRVSKPGEATDVLEELLVMRAYASEPYYTELLDTPLAAFGELTLSSVLNAWTVISRTALISVESVGQKHALGANMDSPAHTWLPEYVPVLQIDALVDALSVAVGILPADGRRLIEFFTFRGKPNQEIWAQPLIPVGPTAVAPIFAAVVSPNLRRLVDVWMRQVGIDLAERGPAFEAHVRAVVVESIRASKVLSGKAMGIEGDYTFRPSHGRAEQIDLLFNIGAVVFVAEAKCILEPTEAKSVYMHRKTVTGAAEQVLRKAQALEANRADFIVDVQRFGLALPQDFQIVPLVIVSTSTHVGISSNGVAVIDEYILGCFLDGELDDVAIQGRGFAIQKRIKTVFYSNLEEAQARASQYFASPPQLRRFLQGLRGRVVPLHSIDEQDWEGRILTLECAPEGGLPLARQPSESIGETGGA
ncbi:hypothetical protein UA18_02734 [Burkholderia multivorans]|uniref:NERD domain-containing protein n=3 Tax=Burkholderia multivorans TaxID=87883 RepID=A0ABD7LM73_9BURK|nr:hypothetical protein [Burkholderia multivorans]SAK21514.1 hypothetical protein UA18_02734 [Burkholderia multivorans]